ncbi:MAG: hypothetical protein HY331_00740 [Chloroflexi bacterium]|nr:hypothetical protein [Chloroflexota bacterium]
MGRREAFRAHQVQFPYHGTYVNLRTGELRVFRGDVPQGSEWQLLSTRFNLSLEQARHIVRGSQLGDLVPERLHYE